MTKQHQALFTELTAQQAAAIQGGLGFRLDSLEIVQAGGDFGSGDDPLVSVNGSNVFSAVNVSANDLFTINRSFDLGTSTVEIALFDDDDFLAGGDDEIQRFTFSGPGTVNQLFDNGTSSYLLRGEILA